MSQSKTGHPAIISMQLRLPDSVLDIAQIGPDFLVLAEPHKYHRPCRGLVSLSIDGVEERFQTFLPVGIQLGAGRVPITSLPLYAAGKISVGIAMGISGMTRREFWELCKRKGFPWPSDADEIDRDLHVTPISIMRG